MAIQVQSTRAELLSPERVPYLSDEERAQVAELLARLEQECEADVSRVILYGSKARGDAVAESDIDLLIACTDSSKNIKKICDEFGFDNYLVKAQVFAREHWENYQRLKLPFYVNVRRDGIELWDEYAARLEEKMVPLDFTEGKERPLDYETIQVIRLYVNEARDRWREAKLVESEISVFRALPHAYYAAFNLATAILYTLNVVRGKHTGIEGALSQLLVKTELIEEEYKDIYSRLLKGRIWSDYERVKKEHLDDYTEEEVTQLLRDAERLIARFERFLRERGAMID